MEVDFEKILLGEEFLFSVMTMVYLMMIFVIDG